jgi:hypothetical protein
MTNRRRESRFAPNDQRAHTHRDRSAMTIRFRQSHNRATTPSQLRIWGIWGDEIAALPAHIACDFRWSLHHLRRGLLLSQFGGEVMGGFSIPILQESP